MNYIEVPDSIADKINQYCRLCLNSNVDLHHLFSSNDSDAFAVSLSMKASLCISMSISREDKLPQKICQKCLDYVNEWFLFRKRARKVHLLLKEKVCDSSEWTKKQDEKKMTDLKKPQSKSFEEKLASGLNPGVSCLKNGSSLEDCRSVGSEQSKRIKFKCPSCPDSFYFLKDLKSHRALMHNDFESDSPKRIRPVADPDIKLDGINIRTRYEMKCCGKVFFGKLKFRKHYLEKHPGEKPFMCETCGKKDFISEETLKRHKVLHSGKFRCEICQKTFTCNAILMLHKRDKHENDRPFICDVCGKRFVTELLMNYHKRFHTGEKKYVCEECGLAVVTSSSLAKHRRIHTQEKPHICHMCGKGFIIKGRLVEHLRMHTGERPYICQICQKGFTIKEKLKRHMKVHSGEKRYSCEYCGNTYSTKCGLLSHLKTHLTNYPEG